MTRPSELILFSGLLISSESLKANIPLAEHGSKTNKKGGNGDDSTLLTESLGRMDDAEGE